MCGNACPLEAVDFNADCAEGREKNKKLSHGPLYQPALAAAQSDHITPMAIGLISESVKPGIKSAFTPRTEEFR